MIRSWAVPIVITNRNLTSWPKAMIQDLRRMDGCGPIVIVDNDSTAPETLDWYDSLDGDQDIAIIYTRANLGHQAPWMVGIPNALYSQYGFKEYIVTDPDLDLSQCPKETLLMLRDMIHDMDPSPYRYKGEGVFKDVQFFCKDKIGLGIRIDDVPSDALFFNECERQYWEQRPMTPSYRNKILSMIQPAPVDTTFAMYIWERMSVYGIGGCRTIDPLVRHLPYYITESNLADHPEFRDYLKKATEFSTCVQTIKAKNIQI
jgi:hypothetical protein